MTTTAKSVECSAWTSFRAGENSHFALDETSCENSGAFKLVLVGRGKSVWIQQRDAHPGVFPWKLPARLDQDSRQRAVCGHSAFGRTDVPLAYWFDGEVKAMTRSFLGLPHAAESNIL